MLKSNICTANILSICLWFQNLISLKSSENQFHFNTLFARWSAVQTINFAGTTNNKRFKGNRVFSVHIVALLRLCQSCWVAVQHILLHLLLLQIVYLPTSPERHKQGSSNRCLLRYFTGSDSLSLAARSLPSSCVNHCSNLQGWQSK